jgi:NYN domain
LAALLYLAHMLKTIVYIDGFNLYYGMLRRSPYKWLDIVKLFTEHVLVDQADVVQVRYYTAPVLGRMSDDLQSPIRQRQYWQALRKLYPVHLTIIEGHMLAGKAYQRLVQPIAQAPHLKAVQVFSFDEKKTDVSLATDMVNGAWQGDYEQAVLCSNDSDLQPALASIHKTHPNLRLGLVAPVSAHPGTASERTLSKDLMRSSHWGKLLNPKHLAAAQLPEKIPGTALRRPLEWH